MATEKELRTAIANLTPWRRKKLGAALLAIYEHGIGQAAPPLPKRIEADAITNDGNSPASGDTAAGWRLAAMRALTG